MALRPAVASALRPESVMKVLVDPNPKNCTKRMLRIFQREEL